MSKNPIKILAVDDHPIVIGGLKLSLQDAKDIEFIGEAYSEAELYAKLQQCSPDIIILDLNIKGDNSLNYLDKIYKIKPHIKVIIFSSYNTSSLIQSALKNKVHGYVLKDTPKDELIQAIYKINEGEKYIPPSVKNQESEINPSSNLIDDFLKKNNLSQRELQVIQLIVKGLTSDDIATQLFISKHTVQSHRKNILRKLSLHNKAEIVKFAYENNLV